MVVPTIAMCALSLMLWDPRDIGVGDSTVFPRYWTPKPQPFLMAHLIHERDTPLRWSPQPTLEI